MTADAYQQLAAAMERVWQANEQMRTGLESLIEAAEELGVDGIADDARDLDAGRILTMVPLGMFRSDVVGALSVRITGRRTDE